MGFYIFYRILTAQEEKVNTGVAVLGSVRTPAAAGGVRWLGRVTQTLPFSPFFACFPKSRMLTQTEPGCEQCGGLFWGAESRGCCLWFSGILNTLGYSPSLRINLYEL